MITSETDTERLIFCIICNKKQILEATFWSLKRKNFCFRSRTKEYHSRSHQSGKLLYLKNASIPCVRLSTFDATLKKVISWEIANEMILESFLNQTKSFSGLTSKILYFLSVDGSWVDSGMLGNVNATILQQKLTSLSTSHKYELVVVTKEDLYRYEWLFTLDLLVPLLSVDYRKMESQLAAAWMADNSTSM